MVVAVHLILLLGMCLAKRHIVLLKDNLSAESIQSHEDWLKTTEIPSGQIKAFGVAGIKGYSADFSHTTANKLRERDDVLLVEENNEYTIQISMGKEVADDMAGLVVTHEEYKLLYAPIEAERENNAIHAGYVKREASAQTNLIKGKRHFRKNPVKKIYRKNRKAPHPLLRLRQSASAHEGMKKQEVPVVLPPPRKTRDLEKGKEYHTAFERLHYPFPSIKLLARVDVPWGLSRISQGNTVYTEDTFVYPRSAGSGVYVYVLDTGIEDTHDELKGRVERGINIVGGNLDARDDHGHGTHCAGIIGGKTVGVASNVKLVPVKILTEEGKGSTEFAVLGLIYAMKSHHQKLKTQKHPRAIINMSLGGVKSDVLKEIAKRAVETGLTIVAAGGNNASNACEYSPASINKVITVGAIDQHDEIAEFSNTGSCVDVYAPGVAIPSSFINNTIRELSGTSMAAPHVAGLAALYLGEEYMAPDDLKVLIKTDAFKSDLIRIASAKVLNLRLE
ncbi:cerevisin [Nematocida ausubeli]|nr:cerevisin [Nematocida ausubeli]KAI5134136.1 cerevisin [Nematocida ausubeli]